MAPDVQEHFSLCVMADLHRHRALGLCLLFALFLGMTLSPGLGCAAAGDGAPPADTTPAEDGKGDSPYSLEGGPCATSFDCELGFECVEGGCTAQGPACGEGR